MIFIKVKQKINTKKALDKDYMFSFFKRKKGYFLPKKERLIGLEVKLVRNFREKFRNMSLKYELITDRGRKSVRARIHKFQDSPLRDGRVLNFLKDSGLGKNIPRFLYYYKPLNILFYLETPGISLEIVLAEKRMDLLLKFIPRIAVYLRKIHGLKGKPPFLPVKDVRQEKKEHQHWFFLVRKCGPELYPRFSPLLKKLWLLRQEKKELFSLSSEFGLVHSDFHWGNVVGHKNRFFFLDFCYAFYGDPLEDVGGFLAQNDSMFRYYAPEFIPEAEKIRQSFLKAYFRDAPDKGQKFRLLYFEIRKILEMAAILSLVETNKDNKTKGMTTLLEKAERKLGELKKMRDE